VIRGVHHVALLTPDFDRLLAFYRNVVGGEVVHEREFGEDDDLELLGRITGIPGRPRLRSAILRLGNAFLEIQHYLEPEGSGDPVERPAQDYGIRHFALDVTDIEAEVERLTAAGMRFFGPVQQPSPRIKAIYGRDPDGNIVEVQELLAEGDRLAIPA
jgi:catechol 2,3-dioxygenase-like lactoylglutathione lyase family enzyme